MFLKKYGIFNVNFEHKIEGVSLDLKNYQDKDFYKEIENIYNKLVEYRGYDQFLYKKGKSKTLKPVDFYVVSHNFVVELDEHQHFTKARLITLKEYPKNFKTGYNLNEWKEKCKNYNRKDNHPEDRDEYRAWADTIRDYIPKIKGFNDPTRRIFLGEKQYCKDFDFQSDESLGHFFKYIGMNNDK